MTGLTFLILFLILMALMAFVPRWLQRFHIPTIISIMIIGILIGPNLFDFIKNFNHLFGRGYPTEQLYVVIDVIGLIGLVFLMSLAGMEANLKLIRSEKKAVVWLSILTFLLPAVAGFFVFRIFRPNDIVGQLFYASLFASHSVGIVFPIIKELKVLKTRFGVAILSSTIITDIASLILLAICVQLVRHQSDVQVFETISLFDHIDLTSLGLFFYPLFVGVVFIYIALVIWLVPVIGKMIFYGMHPGDDSRVTFFLVTVLGVVLVGELFGVSIIVGAFIAGMALSNLQVFHDNDKLFHKKIEGIGYGFFVPFMFLSIGMKTDVTVLLGASENIYIILWTVFGLLGSKIFSGWIAMRISGFSNRKGLLAGLMTVPQLSATIAAAAVGLSLNIIPENFFNAIIILSILTTIPVPIIIKVFITRAKIRFDTIEDVLTHDVEDKVLDEELL
ncbi:MAG: cation:proton antiporter [Bacteroidales bacterium]|jgi:Kef-type K+ transport system membrane component KefB|nr:cation:proton antiporter [Bacteroidales bacterium]